ncbi:MAG: DUF4172 domain-containing protein [Bacteroidota bacterium]
MYLDTAYKALVRFAEKTGSIQGKLQALPADIKTDSIIDMIVAEAVKTSEIEGEFLSRQDVLSSVRKGLGLNTAAEHIKDKMAAGVAELMADVRNTFSDDLDKEKLFAWHNMLLGTKKHIAVGEWRQGPVYVIGSGPIGSEPVHFEGPPAERLPLETERFIEWFNKTKPGAGYEIFNLLIRVAIAHLYFESIHPFEDGNGRIGRAIAEKALSQGLGYPVLMSLSAGIEADKSRYYAGLKQGQQSNEITAWIEYFAETVLEAQTSASDKVDFILTKTRFLDTYRSSLNERQMKALLRIFEDGPEGFKGGMSASKYAGITKTSKATTTRDLQDLFEKGAITHYDEQRGRATKYRLNLDSNL